MPHTMQHKRLLQAFIQEGPISEERLKTLIIRLLNDDRISNVINEINLSLQPMNMLITKVQCELTGDQYWVLASSVIDNVARIQTEFSQSELTIIRQVFSSFMSSDRGCLQSTVCLNLCASSQVKLTKMQAEQFLNDMVEKKWLAYKNGLYCIGVRAIADLMPYFRATYKDELKTCFLCKQVIFHYTKCEGCNNVFHSYCITHFTKHVSVECPACKNPLPMSEDLPEISNRTMD